MKILTVGDVVGKEAVGYLTQRLGTFKRQHGIDLTVVNGENSAERNGIDPPSASALLDAGADVITTGNHVYRIPAVYSYLDDSDRIVRPVNFPGDSPGRGYTVVDTGSFRALVINVLGSVYMEGAGDAFSSVEAALRTAGEYDVSVLDIHAEATSEKAAIARYFDGKINVVFGTHTHVQTNDAQVLPKGTGFITDVGMCGPRDSILGVISDRVIDKLRLHLPARFEYARGNISASGAIFTVENGKTISAETVSF